MEDYRPRKIRVYRNGDIYFPGKKYVVNGRVNKNFEQFLLQLSDEMQLVTGAVRRVYDLETGAIIRNLRDLCDGKYYVAAGAESLKRVSYITTDENGFPLGVGSTRNVNLSGHGGAGTAGYPPIGAGVTMGGIRRGETRQRRKINRSTGGLLMQDAESEHPPAEQPLFGPTSKAYKIIVFENGETVDHGTRMILNYRNCKNFEQLLRNLSSILVLKTGQVRKLFDAETGRRIRTLHDIRPGHNLVAGTFENFKRVAYPKQNLSSIVPVVKRDNDQPRIVTFYPNGDSYHTGLTVTIVRKRFPTLIRLLDTLNHQIELVTGKIQKIYALDGTRIHSMDDFEYGRGYVLVANDDPFIRTRYNVMSLKPHHGAAGLNGSTLKNEYADKIRPVGERSRHHTAAHGDDHNASMERQLKSRQSQLQTQMIEEPVSKPRISAGPVEQKRVQTANIEASHGAESTKSEAPKDKPISRPQTKSREGRQSKTKSDDVVSDGLDAEEIPEDEGIRGARHEDEVYGEPELKRLEGKSKSVRIAKTSKDDDKTAAEAGVATTKSMPSITAATAASEPATSASARATSPVSVASPRSGAQSPALVGSANKSRSAIRSSSKSRTTFADEQQHPEQTPQSPKQQPTTPQQQSDLNANARTSAISQHALSKTPSKEALIKSRSQSKETLKSTPKLPTSTPEMKSQRSKSKTNM